MSLLKVSQAELIPPHTSKQLSFWVTYLYCAGSTVLFIYLFIYVWTVLGLFKKKSCHHKCHCR